MADKWQVGTFSFGFLFLVATGVAIYIWVAEPNCQSCPPCPEPVEPEE